MMMVKVGTVTEMQKQANLHEQAVMDIANGVVYPLRAPRTRKSPVRAETKTRKVHPRLIEEARRLTGGDMSRVVMVDESTVYIVNRAHQPIPGGVRPISTREAS